MNGMLKMDPDSRYSAFECLADPYFDGVRDPEVERLVQALRSTNGARQSQT